MWRNIVVFLDCVHVSVEAFGNNHRKLQKNSRVHSTYNLDFVKMLGAAKKIIAAYILLVRNQQPK